MTGTLTEQPLVEIIREIVAEKWSGALRLTHERVKMVFYFERGTLIYATANLKQYRLADNLQRGGHLSAARLAELQNPPIPDLKLAQVLLSQNLVARQIIAAAFSWQATEMLALALQWREGEWQAESRVRPAEKFELTVPLSRLLLEAARKVPRALVSERWHTGDEVLRVTGTDWLQAPLTAPEGFLLSRLAEMPLSYEDLLSASGLPAEEIRHLLYGLAIAGWLDGADWASALTPTMPAAVAPAPPAPEIDSAEQNQRLLEAYLARAETATNHYQIFQVAPDADAGTLKDAYYNVARKFHPDRYRQAEPELHARIESAFALTTRAYETLKDADQRARYDSRLALDTPAAGFVPPAPSAPPVKKVPPAEPKSPTPPAPQPPVTAPPAAVPKPPLPFGNVPLHRPAQSVPPAAAQKLPPRPTTPSPLIAPPVTSFAPPPPPAAPVAPPLPPPAPVDEATQRRADSQFQRGLSALASGDRIAAISCLAEAVRLMPHHAGYHAYFGLALSSDPHSRRQAENELQTALQLAPHNLDYRVIFAEVLWNIGFPVRAQGELERILSTDPFHRDARALRDKVNAATLKK